MAASATHLATMMATSTGSSMCTSSLISIMMTASAMVSRVTPPMKAPAPTSAKAPGSIHLQGPPRRVEEPVTSAPIASNTSSVPSPISRPRQAPIMSCGTKRPEAMAVPETAAAAGPYHSSSVARVR